MCGTEKLIGESNSNAIGQNEKLLRFVTSFNFGQFELFAISR